MTSVDISSLEKERRKASVVAKSRSSKKSAPPMAAMAIGALQSEFIFHNQCLDFFLVLIWKEKHDG